MEGYEGDIDSGDELVAKRKIAMSTSTLDTELVLPGGDLFLILSGEEYGVGLKVEDFNLGLGIPEIRTKSRIARWLHNQENVDQVDYDEFDMLENTAAGLSCTSPGLGGGRKRKRKSKSVRTRTRVKKTCISCALIFFNNGITNLSQHMKYKKCTAEEKEALQQQCKICAKKILDQPHELQPVTSNSSNVIQATQEYKPKDAQRHGSSTKRKRDRGKMKVCSVCNQNISVAHFRRHYKALHGTAEEKAALRKQRRKWSSKRKLVTATSPVVKSNTNNETESKNVKKKCQICKLSFVNLTLHTNRKHSLEHKRKKTNGESKQYEVDKKVKCTICSKRMYATTLWFHKKRYHGTPEEIRVFLENRRNISRRHRLKHNSVNI